MFYKLKANLIPILAFIIILFELWVVHYNYTGLISTYDGIQRVENSSYSLPKFSDEWVAAGMAKYAIENKALPSVNYLDNNTSYPNLLVVFHTIVAFFFGITQLDPVYNFSIFVILTGFLICLSSYILLRSIGVNKLYSSIAILLLPFITQSSNLPGLWFAIPFTLSISFFIFQLSLMMKGRWKTSLLFSLISLLIYPPMIVFITPSYLGYGRNLKRFIFGLLAIFFVVLIMSIFLINIAPDIKIFNFIIDNIFRDNLEGGMVSYSILHVIPLILIPFIFLGIRDLCKRQNHFLIPSIVTGLLFWVLYVFYPNVIFIEYPRIVIGTSILLVISSGLGLQSVDKYFKKIKYAILPTFFVLALFYPIDVNNNWIYFTTKTFDQNISLPLPPTPPIRYALTSEDLYLFRDISEINFISHPWKALVLGTVTDNDPIESKPSTVGVRKILYRDFISSSCEDKFYVIKKYNVSFIYSANVVCPGFQLIGKSSEGLRMYDVRDLN